MSTVASSLESIIGDESFDDGLYITENHEIKGLFTLTTKNLFCSPPIPRNLKDLAEIMIPKNVLEKNHGIKDFIEIATDVKNYKTHWTTECPSADKVATSIVIYSEQVFMYNNPWSGYMIYKNKGSELIGVGSFKEGFGLGIIEIDAFVVSSNVNFYEEVVVTLLFAAEMFAKKGFKLKGCPIKKIFVSIIDPRECILLNDFSQTLLKRQLALKRIFGDPTTIIPEKHPFNSSGFKKYVYGCDVLKIKDILNRYP